STMKKPDDMSKEELIENMQLEWDEKYKVYLSDVYPDVSYEEADPNRYQHIKTKSKELNNYFLPKVLGFITK
ncbi:hypothetical protein, partial [Avibacterium avium]|uniref:hypothetical protein n=1 Tax=Avibacterium avium TaxID=751 RepID=UPI003BF901B1